MPTSQPIRDKEKLKQFADYYLQKEQLRNHALVVLGTHTALRIGDLLKLKWNEVYNFQRNEFRSHMELTEKKTGKKKSIAMNKKIIQALSLLFDHKKGDYIFANNRKNAAPITRVQAWRIIKTAAEAIGLSDQHISCHSMRKSLGYHAWKDGASPVILMDIYNHSSYAVTRRYLGVSQDDRDSVYLNLELF